VIQHRGRELSILLDVGHNPHAATYLAHALQRQPLGGRRLAVFGLLADKDLHGVIGPLLPVVDDWAVAPLSTPRARSGAQLSEALMEHGASVTIYSSVCEALDAQCDRAVAGDEILLFGSFYCVAEALDLAEHYPEVLDYKQAVTARRELRHEDIRIMTEIGRMKQHSELVGRLNHVGETEHHHDMTLQPAF